eukprot:TRINITY_DN1595_c0_g1_i1.p1 TRINITY_DN1595_c0_g1~~TRINITY_DN1595_c0_g1_i1.p1  ORF type:complete len:276 (-),score=67.91 TRINITY_DN1595_c0_g1_i1:169-996(-)
MYRPISTRRSVSRSTLMILATCVVSTLLFCYFIVTRSTLRDHESGSINQAHYINMMAKRMGHNVIKMTLHPHETFFVAFLREFELPVEESAFVTCFRTTRFLAVFVSDAATKFVRRQSRKAFEDLGSLLIEMSRSLEICGYDEYSTFTKALETLGQDFEEFHYRRLDERGRGLDLEYYVKDADKNITSLVMDFGEKWNENHHQQAGISLAKFLKEVLEDWKHLLVKVDVDAEDEALEKHAEKLREEAEERVKQKEKEKEEEDREDREDREDKEIE